MTKRSIRQSCVVAWFAIVVVLSFAAPSSPSMRPRQKINVNLLDTGATVALGAGEQLVVTLPLSRYDDDTWTIVRNSGASLKLIAGPNEKRPRDWTPFRRRAQVFYFERETPGTAHLVLEQAYWSKPMVLRVVDR